jgi:hypothetical protein
MANAAEELASLRTQLILPDGNAVKVSLGFFRTLRDELRAVLQQDVVRTFCQW